MYCTEKITYETRREAYEALQRFRKGKRGSVYECDVCGKWHITHMSHDRWRARKIQVDEWQTKETTIGKHVAGVILPARCNSWSAQKERWSNSKVDYQQRLKLSEYDK